MVHQSTHMKFSTTVIDTGVQDVDINTSGTSTHQYRGTVYTIQITGVVYNLISIGSMGQVVANHRCWLQQPHVSVVP